MVIPDDDPDNFGEFVVGFTGNNLNLAGESEYDFGRDGSVEDAIANWELVRQ